jgi:hypothetical protein
MPRPKAAAPWAILALLVVGAALAGYFFLVAPVAQPPKFSLLVDFDVSESQNQRERKRLSAVLDSTVDMVLPTRSRVVIWAFDHDPLKVYSGRPASARDLWTVQDEIFTASLGSQPGTYPSRVLEQNLEEAQKAVQRGERIAVMLLWDGDNADPEATKKAAEELAALPNLKALWVVGVQIESGQALRSQVERIFASLGDRLIVSGRYDVRDGQADFRQKVIEGL